MSDARKAWKIVAKLIGLSAVLALGCGGSGAGGGEAGGSSSLLPADYQSSFTQVSGCKLNVGHGLLMGTTDYTTVLTTPAAAQLLLSKTFPFPEGTMFVAVESSKPDCSTVTGFTLMAKQAPGYDPAEGDWQWQQLGSTRTVVQSEVVQQCQSCHSGPGSTGEDFYL